MSAVALSIVVVSRGRPDGLMRCLAGLAQQRHAPFEVIVVADPAGVARARQWPQAAHVKIVPFDEANISAARNAGIMQAAGEAVAFIDDDAVPEPTWAARMAAAFADDGVSAAGGFVLGRNGISWQWRAQSVDGAGRTAPLEIGEDPLVLTPTGGRAIKTEGTNMAFRRSVLAALGGADADGLADPDAVGRHCRATLSELAGPWALVYLHRASSTLHFGRDRLGRRSLCLLEDPGYVRTTG